MFDSEYLNRMKEMLGSSYPAFFESINSERTFGLRFNGLKVADLESTKNLLNIDLEPIQWEKLGYYYDGEKDKPGKSVLHDIGAFYIQEPSAQSVVPKLNLKFGEVVLDMCAAPGGKSTQILSYLNNSGILVSNEIVRDRAMVLASNIERMGAKNSIVLNNAPDELASHLQLCFDKILIDSPCSGEGMFRKNPDACNEWSVENVEICIKRDDEILDAAAVMLKMGGRMVYSTCTFEYGENEGAIERFLSRHPEFKCIEEKRLYPHEVRGEGHFYAVLIKGEENLSGRMADDLCSMAKSERGKSKKDVSKIPVEYSDFLKGTLSEPEPYMQNITINKDQVIVLPREQMHLDGLRVVRAGLNMGIIKKNRFEPSHTLAMTLKKEDVLKYYECNDAEIRKYLRGETLNCDLDIKGWVLILYNGISAGFGKAAGGIIKNHYPKGLRRFD